MAATVDVNVTDSAWALVADGASSVFLQLKTTGPVRLYIGAAEPAADSVEGVALTRAGIAEIGFDGLDLNDKVWLKGRDANGEVVAVITVGG